MSRSRRLSFVLAWLAVASTGVAANGPTTSLLGGATRSVATVPGKTPVAPVNQAKYVITGSVVPTCTGIEGDAASVLADRDNSGTGVELGVVEAFDGNNNLLFTFNTTAIVGDSVSFGSAPYTTPPSVNPLRIVVTSLAGNGFTEVRQEFTGICAGLPNATTLPVPANASWMLTLLTALVGALGLAWTRIRAR